MGAIVDAVIVVFERRTPHEHLVTEHTDAPHVRAVRVGAVVGDFGREVLWRSAARLAHHLRCVHRPPEVRKLDVVLVVKENVLGFDVAMHDLVIVQILEGLGELSDVLGGLSRGEGPRLLELRVQHPADAGLQDELDVGVRPEVAVRAQEVDVARVVRNFDLAAELVEHAHFYETLAPSS